MSPGADPGVVAKGVVLHPLFRNRGKRLEPWVGGGKVVKSAQLSETLRCSQ